MLTKTLLLTAAQGGYGEQLIILALGWLLGVLSLGLCQLSYLGYLKLKELAATWHTPAPRADTDDPPPPDEAPAVASPAPARLHRLRPATSAAPTASRPASRHHHSPAYAALRRNAGPDPDDLSA